MEKLFFRVNNITTYNMDKFGKIEMKKIRPIKNSWYEWLINYIPDPTRKYVKDLKDEIESYFKSINYEQAVPAHTDYGRGQKLSKPRKRVIRKPFISEENKGKNKD